MCLSLLLTAPLLFTITADEAHFALEQQSSTSKLHGQLDDISPTASPVHASRCSDRDKRNRRMVNRSEVTTPDVSSIWQPICRLVEEDLKNMEWLARDGANIVAEMDSEILDHLICEATAELVHLSSDAVCVLPLLSPVPRICSGKTSNWRYPYSRNTQARQGLQATEHEWTNCQSFNHVLQSENGSPVT